MNVLIVIFTLIIFGLIGYFSVNKENPIKEKILMTLGTSIPGLFMSLLMINSSM